MAKHFFCSVFAQKSVIYQEIEKVFNYPLIVSCTTCSFM